MVAQPGTATVKLDEARLRRIPSFSDLSEDAGARSEEEVVHPKPPPAGATGGRARVPLLVLGAAAAALGLAGLVTLLIAAAAAALAIAT